MYVVDGQRCTGCGICLSFCDRGALSIKSDVAVIDQQRCCDCGDCGEACPQGAVHDLNKPRRMASERHPMYGRESPFPLETENGTPPPRDTPLVLRKQPDPRSWRRR